MAITNPEGLHHAIVEEFPTGVIGERPDQADDRYVIRPKADQVRSGTTFSTRGDKTTSSYPEPLAVLVTESSGYRLVPLALATDKS